MKMKNIENLIESVKTGNGTNFYILKNIDKTTFLKNGIFQTFLFVEAITNI